MNKLDTAKSRYMKVKLEHCKFYDKSVYLREPGLDHSCSLNWSDVDNSALAGLYLAKQPGAIYVPPLRC